MTKIQKPARQCSAADVAMGGDDLTWDSMRSAPAKESRIYARRRCMNALDAAIAVSMHLNLKHLRFDSEKLKCYSNLVRPWTG